MESSAPTHIHTDAPQTSPQKSTGVPSGLRAKTTIVSPHRGGSDAARGAPGRKTRPGAPSLLHGTNAPSERFPLMCLSSQTRPGQGQNTQNTSITHPRNPKYVAPFYAPKERTEGTFYRKKEKMKD